MIKESEQQIISFLKGFWLMFPIGTLAHFSPNELELIISGSQKVDVSKLKEAASYQKCSKDDNIIGWFWELIDDMSEDEKSMFIFYLCGSTRLPYEGDSVT